MPLPLDPARLFLHALYFLISHLGREGTFRAHVLFWDSYGAFAAERVLRINIDRSDAGTWYRQTSKGVSFLDTLEMRLSHDDNQKGNQIAWAKASEKAVGLFESVLALGSHCSGACSS